MIFSFETLNILYVYVLLGVAVLLTVVCSAVLWRRAARLRKFTASEASREYVDEEHLPSVSVVVYAHNECENLERFLPLLLHQDYPDFDVVVVDDASFDGTRDLLSDMLPHFSNLRVTFAPEATRSLSRKKLALTIGIKASQKEVVLTTNANCRVMSDQWLRSMMRNFVPGIDVVLGFSHYRYRKDTSGGRFYRVFDSVVTSLQWVGSAIKGKPYRGISDNLAYRREVFFQHSGFSKSLDLKFGDDDVFVSEIADGTNTRLELAPESQVQTYYDNVPKAHHLLKLRRDYTTQFVSTKAPFYAQAFFSWMNYLRLGALIAAVAIDYTNVFTISASALLLILSWVMVILPFNRCCQALQAPGLTLSVPLFYLWRPVLTLYYRMRGISTRKTNLTSMYE
ncbi:MAG: glycosyltransferase [Bacteroidales bacterium]|nr:glycosyltransferase [Bacteroidales bacterium]